MTNDYKTNISKYSTATSVISTPIVLFDALLNIHNGSYKHEVMTCRTLFENGDKIAYKKAKTLLPAVTFSGEFSGSHKSENLKHYSHFIIIDIDALDKESVEQVKLQLFEDKYVAAIWVSPSGCGLKVLIKIKNNEVDHKKCFDTLTWYLLDNYGVEVDKSGSDICRLCFVSFDDRMLLKENLQEYDYQDFYSFTHQKEAIPNETPVTKKEKHSLPTHSISENVLFKGTKNRNLEANRVTIAKIIKYLNKNNASITSTYNDWFRIACAIANTFTFDLGEKYYLALCRLDGALHDEYKSQQLLEYCYRNRRIGTLDFSTIVYLAKQKGFLVSLK